MAKLINGSGNPAVYANEDADLIAALAGNTTAIAAVGSEYAATQEDANTIGLADGVIITKEGRRIQLDEGRIDLFTIPTGTAGTTSYYIIGYKLSTDLQSKQTCETFVQKMDSSSATITEDTFKGGATDVYVSVYRVVQNGLNIDSINLLLPKLSNVGQLNSDLSDFSFRNNSGTAQYSMDNGTTWTNFKNPTGTKSITSNGTYDITDYASASVNVGLSRTTLWTNPSPGASFIASNVSLNSSISNYSYIQIEYAANSSTLNNVRGSAIMTRSEFQSTNNQQGVGTGYMCHGFQIGGYYYYRPTWYVDNSTVSFYTGLSNGGLNNAAVIPIAIYGLR